MKTTIRTLILTLALVLLTACGGGSNGNISHDTAIDKFVAYAESNGTSERPTLQDYLDAGVKGVTEDNLEEINEVIENLTKDEVDTAEELQALADQLGVVVDTTAPHFTSPATATVIENQISAITLAATDANTITYSISGDDSADFSVDASTGVVTFNTAPDYETETSYSFTATATDTAGNAATQSVTVTVLNDACTGGDVISHLGTDYCTVTSPYTGEVWLDRNLGASQVCTSFDDSACYGDYYQWGRNFDGHEDSTSTSIDAGDASQAANVSNVGHGDFIESNNTYSYDWAKSADGDGSLRSANWSATDGSSVCPVGFRVPTIDELKAELLDAGSAEITDRDDAFNSFLKLPSAGYHSGYSGTFGNQGSWGYVWCSSVYGSNSRSVYFRSGSAGEGSSRRAFGYTVRCLRD